MKKRMNIGKVKNKLRRNRKRIIIISVILWLVLRFAYLFSVAFDDHYDVKKGTLLWYATMDNKTITKFPVIEPYGRAVYNSIGGDRPSIAAGWEIQYTSNADSEALTEKILDYLEKRGFTVEEVEERYWYWWIKKAESSRFYSGVNERRGEGLDLAFFKTKNGKIVIECTILY